MTDVKKLITENIDVWTSAIKKRNATGRGSNKKIELSGIKKLRELILELAVRGKLVSQDANDEPASILLEKIAAKKTQLISDKKIKKTKALPEITQNEVLSILPKGWVNCRLNDLVYLLGDGLHGTPEYSTEGDYYFINGNNLKNGKIVIKHETKRVDQEQFDKYKKELTDNTVFVSINGTLGNVAFYNNEKIVLGKSACYFNLADCISKLFIKCVIESPHFIHYAFEKASGSTIKNLGLKAMNMYVISLPPLAEQHRIVAKVDELMALCDELEQQTEQSLTAHQTLVEVLLATLTQSANTNTADVGVKDGSEKSNKANTKGNVKGNIKGNSEDFQTCWQRIAEHFDVLFTTEASIEQLKQTILQLAVMGKLVPQNPVDEPASVLLEKIAEEKAQLIADKKIKKQKPLPAITDEEKPFELPNGWGLTRLDDICAGITSGSTPPKDKFDEKIGVPYLKVYNIKNQKIAFDYRPQFVEVEYNKKKLTRSILYPNDVVMNIVGPPLGKIAIIPDDYPEWNCNQAIVFFRALDPSLSGYIYTYLTSGRFLDAIELIGTAGQDNISVTKSRSIIFPMPPLAEQHRIVAKVDELMAICEQLKTRLSDAQTTQLHLADAVVENALNGSEAN
ncbi:restriction endonuclease subunit S [uncultured Psychromonas sp.]|uniref:restriction endonuclease subunit S n=1 Tax=uncultured Psychromonas sp. TaxID=173974 RepID=UPI002611D93B|nr:restriction endonuclease subunit S [uncultured Psychromonas sp.]